MAKTWVLVADSGRARILLAEKPNGALTELETFDNPAVRVREQELTSDLPGRSFDSLGQQRHAMEPHDSPKHHEAVNFAHRLGAHLAQAQQRGEFEHLILVAPPKFLGLLRQQLGDELSRKVTVEIDKNLCALDNEQLHEHLPFRW